MRRWVGEWLKVEREEPGQDLDATQFNWMLLEEVEEEEEEAPATSTPPTSPHQPHCMGISLQQNNNT